MISPKDNEGYDPLEDEDFEECTCDITGEDGCPVHYPIDDGTEDDDCMDCGLCDDCIKRTRDAFEIEEAALHREAKP